MSRALTEAAAQRPWPPKGRPWRGVRPVFAAEAALPVVCCVSLKTGGAALRENAARFFGGKEERGELIYFL